MSKTIPLVDYLVLEPEPHLVANECTACGARYLDRRNGCASCGQHSDDGSGWRKVPIETTGELTTFTIVDFGEPYVAGVIDCDGTSVRGNVINVEPDPEHVRTGMKLRLTTVAVGTDSEGTEAVGFGFEPLDDETNQEARP